MGKNIEEILRSKRAETDEHIRQLEKDGKQGIRYTAMLSNMAFLALGLVCDMGWITYLIAGFVYCSKSDLVSVFDWIILVVIWGVITGVMFTIYLNKIHEKEIATRFQKNMSVGLTIFSALIGAIIAIFQMMLYTGFSTPLFLVVIGGILTFAAGLPIFLSFKKGIKYGVH